MVSGTAALLFMFFKKGSKERFGTPKVHQAALRREIENTQGAGYTESFAAGRRHAFAVIHQQEIGVKEASQGYGGFSPSSRPSSEGSKGNG